MQKLWVSPKLDCAGFLPLQIGKWARGTIPQLSEAEVRDVVGELERKNWIAVDFDVEEVFLRPYIRWDACKQPQIYIAACRAIQAAESPELRRAAWEQMLIADPPTSESLKPQQTRAYEELWRFMQEHEEAFREPSGSLPEGSVMDTDVGKAAWTGEGTIAAEVVSIADVTALHPKPRKRRRSEDTA